MQHSEWQHATCEYSAASECDQISYIIYTVSSSVGTSIAQSFICIALEVCITNTSL